MSDKAYIGLEEPLRRMKGLSHGLYAVAGTAEGSSTNLDTLEFFAASLAQLHAEMSKIIADGEDAS